MNSGEFEIETLLAREEWVLDVARAVSGRDVGDDVAQDIWLGLLTRKHPIESLGGWLRTRARRRAIDLRREAGSRRRRESAAARDERLPSSAELVEQASARREIVRAVLDLPEPYRTTVLLRYFDDRPSSEIAEKLGIPAATVRVRLKRGVDMLREDFHKDPEGRTAVLVVLAAARPVRTSTALGAIVIAVAAALLVGWFIVEASGEREVPRLSPVAREESSRGPARPIVVAPAPEATPLEHPASRNPTVARHLLRGSVSLASATPLDTVIRLRAEARVTGPDANRQFGLFGKPAGRYRFVSEGVTRPGEGFEIGVAARGLYFVAVTASGVRGFTSFVANPDVEGSFSLAVADEIVLEPSSHDVTIRYAESLSDSGEICWAEAGRSGDRVRIPGPVFTNLLLRASTAGNPIEWEVRLGRESARVSPPTASPLRAVQIVASPGVDATAAKVEVQISTKDSTTWRCVIMPDAEGRCWIPWPHRTDVSWYSFTATLADGRVLATRGLRDALETPGDRIETLRIHVPAPRPQRLRIQDAEGRGVGGAAITGCVGGLPVARGLSAGNGDADVKRRLCVLDLDGDDLRMKPASPLDLYLVDREGALFDLGAVASSDGREVVTLPEPRRVRIVVTTRGAPLEGAGVAITPSRSGQPLGRLAPLQWATTDAAGSVSSIPLGPGRWHLSVRADGLVPHRSVFDREDGEVRVALEAVGDRSTAANVLSFRLETPGGDPLPGAVVRATPDGRHMYENRTDSHGAAVIQGLTPGRDYRVEIEASGFAVSLRAPTTFVPSVDRRTLIVVPIAAATVKTSEEVPQVVVVADGPPGCSSSLTIAAHGVPFHLNREDQQITLYAPGRETRTTALSEHEVRPGMVLDVTLEPGPALTFGLTELLEAARGALDVTLEPVRIGLTKRHDPLLRELRDSFVVAWRGRRDVLEIESMTPGRWRLVVKASERVLCDIELDIEDDTDLGDLPLGN